jgi:predicted porin
MALAVGAAFAAPAAYADVTLSGTINMGVEYINVGKQSRQAADLTSVTPGGPRQDGNNNMGIATNYSNVNISSMEDLGGGLKLDFNFQLVAPTASVSGVSNRNSRIGLVGDSWGGVWIGSNENIYERYLYTIDPLDGAAGLGGNLQMLGTPGGAVFTTCGNATNDLSNNCGYTFYRRDEQVIWYDSPNWNGFTFGAVWQTNYSKKRLANNTTINPNMWQLGAKYAGTTMPLELWAAYARRKDQFGALDWLNNTSGDNTLALSLRRGLNITGPLGINSLDATNSTDYGYHFGGAYTLGDIKLFGGYENLKWKLDAVTANAATSPLDLGTTTYKRGAWYIGMKWNLASGYVGAQFIQALKGKLETGAGNFNGEGTGAYMVGLGYYHNMSKQTQLYAVGSWVDNKSLATYGTAGISNSSNLNTAGATVWGAGVGIRHAF